MAKMSFSMMTNFVVETCLECGQVVRPNCSIIFVLVISFEESFLNSMSIMVFSLEGVGTFQNYFLDILIHLEGAYQRYVRISSSSCIHLVMCVFVGDV